MDALWRLADAGIVVLNPPKAVECAVDKYLASVRLESWMQRVPEAFFQAGGAACVGRPHFPGEHRYPDDTAACVPKFHGSSRLVTVPTYEFRGSPGYYWVTGLPTLVWPDRPGMFGQLRLYPMEPFDGHRCVPGPQLFAKEESEAGGAGGAKEVAFVHEFGHCRLFSLWPHRTVCRRTSRGKIHPCSRHTRPFSGMRGRWGRSRWSRRKPRSIWFGRRPLPAVTSHWLILTEVGADLKSPRSQTRAGVG
jgi:hypothetical protein